MVKIEHLEQVLENQMVTLTDKILYDPCIREMARDIHLDYYLYPEVILIPTSYGKPEENLFKAVMRKYFPKDKSGAQMWNDQKVRELFEFKIYEVMEK